MPKNVQTHHSSPGEVTLSVNNDEMNNIIVE